MTALSERFPRVALAHEWLTVPGGSEKVVLSLLDTFPSAELFTTVYDPRQWPAAITDRVVHTSFLNRLPGARRHYPKLLPLMDHAFRSFDLSDFDLVLSSNHACAKNVRKPAGVPHVCYCHTPMRYAWNPAFLDGEQLSAPARLAFRALAPHLRHRDRTAAALPAGPDVIIANSTFVAERIRLHWGREARVIHPPVDVDRFLDVTHAPGEHYLFFGRLVPYKRADLAVAACARLGRPLKLIGTGRAIDDARALAGPHTEFLGHVDDSQLATLLGSARALLFPGEEDFGIVPVEAQAAGLPVIAYGSGGVRDSVLDGATGVLYDDSSVDGLCAAIERFESITLADADLRAQAKRFAPARFTRELTELIDELV
ncbi:MAG TPA: glycosyltransferase [Solirubrobacteraceae bacterium]|nr:glycosyltransferase [Solirubrobacteraceae bacterium]